MQAVEIRDKLNDSNGGKKNEGMATRLEQKVKKERVEGRPRQDGMSGRVSVGDKLKYYHAENQKQMADGQE